MANRSYLYSFNEDKEGKINKIFDISEQNYEIPIIYKILVSENTKIVTSQIFENSLALKGDAILGRKRLNAFFKKLHKENFYDDKELSELEELFQNHLDKYTLDYFLFEPIEVIEMDDVDADQEVKEIKNEVGSYSKMINDFIKYEKEAPEWSSLGIDFSNSLYYTLGKQEEVQKIEKQFSNKKLAKIKTELAKKSTVKRYISLIFELDREKDTQEINETVEKALQLNPTQEQYKILAKNYQDLEKKIELYKTMQEKFPQEDYTFWISNTYVDLEQYDLALEYCLQHLINENNPLISIWDLEAIIKGGNFNEVEIYQDLSKKVKIKEVEKRLIEIFIKQKEYDKAFNRFYEIKDFLSDKGLSWRQDKNIYTIIIRAFIDAKQFEKAMKIIKDTKKYSDFTYYFQQQKQHDKALCNYLKNGGGFGIINFIAGYFENGDYAKEHVNLPEIFKTVLSQIEDFKPNVIIDTSKQFLELTEGVNESYKKQFLLLAEKLLLSLLPLLEKQKDKAKAHLLLSKTYKKQGKKELSKQHKEKSFSYDDTEKFKILYKENYKNKNYLESAEALVKYIQTSNKKYIYFTDKVEAFYDNGLYEESILLILVLIEKMDDDFDKLRFYNLLGLSYLWLDKFDEAYVSLLSGYELDSSEKAIHTNLIRCGKEQLEQATNSLELNKALEIFTFCLSFSQKTEIYTYLGAVYDNKNNNKKALDYFTLALKKSPKNKDCISRIKYIEKKIKKSKDFFELYLEQNDTFKFLKSKENKKLDNIQIELFEKLIYSFEMLFDKDWDYTCEMLYIDRSEVKNTLLTGNWVSWTTRDTLLEHYWSVKQILEEVEIDENAFFKYSGYFMYMLEVLLEKDWLWTCVSLGIDYKGVTFLNPQVEDETEDWGYRGAFLMHYRECKKYI